MKSIIKTFAQLNILIGVVLILVPFVYIFTFMSFSPQIVASNGIQSENKILSTAITKDGSTVYKSGLTAKARSTDNTIKIPSIGVDTNIYEGGTDMLEKGVWLVPTHTTPDDLVSGNPVVIAAHRWGPDDASYEFRSKHLFYNLPTVNIGSEIVVNWSGKDYKYRIVKKDEGEYVSGLADLILYTCKYYNSPIRIFVYAELIE